MSRDSKIHKYNLLFSQNPCSYQKSILCDLNHPVDFLTIKQGYLGAGNKNNKQCPFTYTTNIITIQNWLKIDKLALKPVFMLN